MHENAIQESFDVDHLLKFRLKMGGPDDGPLKQAQDIAYVNIIEN